MADSTSSAGETSPRATSAARPSPSWLAYSDGFIDADRRTTRGAPPTAPPRGQPEDLVIYKAVAWRPQDPQDVERLLVLHGARMDLERIRRHVRELGEAMEQDRIRELDALIRRLLDR